MRWIKIPGYENYEVSSSYDRVRSSNYRHTGVAKELSNTECRGYIRYSLHKSGKQKTLGLHQIVYITFIDNKYQPSKRKVVDHKDNDPKNNHPDNLQVITHRDNVSKDRDNKTSKYTGVCWDKQMNKWRSLISINKVRVFLGLFDTEYEAHLAYQGAKNSISEQ